MTMKNERAQARFAHSALVAAIAVVCSSAAMAGEIDTGNPDINVRWDNTVRYNLGTRMEGQDARILNNTSYDESDSKFGKGNVVTNRIDLLSELDLSYKKMFGARVSAAGWYDQAYDNRSVTSPAGGMTSYYNNEYNSTVSRYVNGPSGEFLDAFVWSNFNLGAVPVNVKLGRHSMAWGEGLLIGAHAVSYSQAPIDGAKAVSSPGIETKEVFLPVNQLSFKAQLTNDLTLAGQYMLEWKPTRVPNPGTYLSNGDTMPSVDRVGITPTFGAPNVGAMEPTQNANWGLSARLNVEAINSTIGLYYRQFSDYNPGAVEYMSFTQLVPGNPATTVPASFRFNYQPDVKQISLSLARSIGPVSFGSELSLRQNGALVGTGISAVDHQGPRGDTLHAVVNGVYLLPKTSFWDTGSLIGELAYSRLQNITANENLYKGVGTTNCKNVSVVGAAAGSGDVSDGCATNDFLQMAVNFTPQYLGIFPSWDLDLPLTINYGIRGNAPSVGGGSEGVLSWSIGAKLTYMAKHEFSLRYSDVSAPSKYDAAGTKLVGGTSSNVSGTDRGWLVFTYKTSF